MFAAFILATTLAAQAAQDTKPAGDFPPAGDPTPQKPEYAPKSYDARFAKEPPKLDGRLDDDAWKAAPWTDEFVDIQGPALPAPRYRTRAKMLWDDEYFYIAAEMLDPHVWGSLKNHDDIVFRDNDFEVFIDPNGDAREYYELEVNALGTIFDLYLYRRYKEEGPAEHGWNAEGLKTAIAVQGTLNDPTDTDTGWTLEWAIPWKSLVPPAWDKPSFGEKARGAAVPKDGETWRVNFSRVQWLHNFEGKTAPKPEAGAAAPAYEKTAGKPEDNWTWTPQWQIDMHDPRWWGKVRFVK
ncbi:MAG: carbohydrate-binding family 9-like protein [Phycisphaerales bacterium]